MNRKTCVLAILAISTLAVGGAFIASDGGVFMQALAEDSLNEYGCRQNCTGEYIPSHVKSILREDSSKNGSKNVRIKCEYIKDIYFKDIGAQLTYTADSDNNAMALDVGFTWWNDVGADYRGEMKAGDIVCLVGTVSYELYGVRRLVVRDPVIYSVNDMINTSLLPEVNYIG